MSRCFPFPPPGYTLSRASNEALIESIKLQKEREKAKYQKEKRREKKEKKKQKKDKRKEKKDDASHKLHNSDIVKCQITEKVWPDMKHKFSLKGKEAETEQLLERSSLTEEHGQPMFSNVSSTSSDSTHTSNKRNRHPSPSKDGRGHGNIIRIKFLPERQKDSNSSADELRFCSKSGGADLAAQNTDFNNLRDGRESSHSALKTDREQICTTSRPVESVTQGKTKIHSVPRPVESVVQGKTGLPTVPNAVVTSMQREEMKYNKLFGSWSPPMFQDSCLDEDLNWFYQSMKPDLCAEKRRKIQSDGISCSSSAASWPHAQLLKEVDLYALPLTVPF